MVTHAIGQSEAARPPYARLTSSFIPALFFCALLIVALMPMLFYPLGISGDYPNHLARVYIEHQLPHSTALQEHFVVTWGIYPDLAMDLFMRPIMAVTDPYTAGAIFNLVAVAMLPIGVALLSKATTGRVGLPAAASVLVIYGAPLAWGFINFVFAAGLALWAFAFWAWLRPGWRRTAVFAGLMPVLFFSHVLGFLLFGYLLLAFEIGRFFAGERSSAAHFLRGLVLRDGLTVVVPLLLFAASLRDRLSGLETELSDFGGFKSRHEAIVSPFAFDNATVTAVLIVGCYLGLGFAFRRGWLILAPELHPVFLACVLLVIAVPSAFSGISFLHIRFGALPVAILLAGASLSSGGRAGAIAMLGLLLGLLTLQQTYIHQRMAFLDHAQTEVRRAVAKLPKGARVAVGAEVVTPLVYRLFHAPAFVVIESDGYVANLFTNTSPVGVSEAARRLHRPQAWPLSAASLLEGARHEPPQYTATNGFQENYHYGWPQTFDALLWFAEPGAPDPYGNNLPRVADADFFRLYAISPSPDL